jgi:hypothetical protein
MDSQISTESGKPQIGYRREPRDGDASYTSPELHRLGSLKSMTLFSSGSVEDGKPASFTQPPWR